MTVASLTDHHIALVCNPGPDNRRALGLVDRVKLLLQAKHIPFHIFVSNWPDNFDGYTAAWIFGGDGTLHFFINRYPEITIPLALFAGGSGNDFHWMLYSDEPPENGVERCLRGNSMQVDAGWCNGQIFLNGIGIGFDGAVVKDLLGKKKLAGKATYLLSIMKHILRYQEQPFIFDTGGGSFGKDCFLISIANGKRYGGGFCVAPKAVVDDGKLDLCVIGSINPVNRMRYLPVIEKGTHLQLPFIKYEQHPSVIIETPSLVHAHADGEYFTANRFEVRCLPGKFRFLV